MFEPQSRLPQVIGVVLALALLAAPVWAQQPFRTGLLGKASGTTVKSKNTSSAKGATSESMPTGGNQPFTPFRTWFKSNIGGRSVDMEQGNVEQGTPAPPPMKSSKGTSKGTTTSTSKSTPRPQSNTKTPLKSNANNGNSTKSNNSTPSKNQPTKAVPVADDVSQTQPTDAPQLSTVDSANQGREILDHPCICHPDSRRALISALNHRSEVMRLAAVQAIAERATIPCDQCKKSLCQDELIVEILADMAYAKDANQSWMEPSENVRRVARDALRMCHAVAGSSVDQTPLPEALPARKGTFVNEEDAPPKPLRKTTSPTTIQKKLIERDSFAPENAATLEPQVSTPAVTIPSDRSGVGFVVPGRGSSLPAPRSSTSVDADRPPPAPLLSEPAPIATPSNLPAASSPSSGLPSSRRRTIDKPAEPAIEIGTPAPQVVAPAEMIPPKPAPAVTAPAATMPTTTMPVTPEVIQNNSVPSTNAAPAPLNDAGKTSNRRVKPATPSSAPLAEPATIDIAPVETPAPPKPLEPPQASTLTLPGATPARTPPQRLNVEPRQIDAPTSGVNDEPGPKLGPAAKAPAKTRSSTIIKSSFNSPLFYPSARGNTPSVSPNATPLTTPPQAPGVAWAND